MENKKSVLLYCDIIHTVNKLDNENAGLLFKHYLNYINDLEPEAPNLLVEIAFEPIKQNLKRDLNKWKGIIEVRSNAGKKSAEKRKKEKEDSTNLTNVDFVENDSTLSTVTVNVNVNVNVNDNVNVKDINIYSNEILECFHNLIGYFPESLHPDKTKTVQNWFDTIEKLNRIDKIPLDLIQRIVKKVRNDEFWKKNFLSIPKLRKKNRDDILYIIVFYEQFKTVESGKNSDPFEHLR